MTAGSAPLRRSCFVAWLAFTFGLAGTALGAEEKPIVGLIPKAQQPITLDGKLDDWHGAFVTPVHVGHPDLANRLAEFLFLWDEQNLYIGLRCLDQKPAHVAPDNRIYDGDAVEFYLDTRRGEQLGAAQFTPGALHMFWTPFTGTDVKPRMQVRDLPVFRNFSLQGAAVAGQKTSWGYTAEFKLPWALFPNFKAKAGEVLGIDCELCSSDGGPRVDRTFVYSSPQSVSTPATFGRVQLVDKLDPQTLKPFGRVLLPLGLTRSANYPWLYGTVCLPPPLADGVTKLEGKVVDREGKSRKTTTGSRKKLGDSGFVLWTGSWELFDLPAGTYTLELTAFDKENHVLTARKVPFLHGETAPSGMTQNPSPMVEHTRAHVRLPEEKPRGKRLPLSLGTLFLPETLPLHGKVPLLIHFHGSTWLPEVAAAKQGRTAVLPVHLGSGSAVYARAFADPDRFGQWLAEAERAAGVHWEPVMLSAWSAGYGALREILQVASYYDRVQSILLIDGLHAGYVTGRPGPGESQLVEDNLEVFLRFARDAVAGKKRMLVTHSEIFPGTFASTTETADYLLQHLGLRRQPTLRWGPGKMQQLSEVRAGQLQIVGYAGNAAPDHVDQLHALPEYLHGVE